MFNSFIVLFQFVELPNQPETHLAEKLYTKDNSSGYKATYPHTQRESNAYTKAKP